MRAAAGWLGQGIRAPLALGALALALYALFGADAYGHRVLTLAGVFALLVIGYQFIFGHAGALSLAQGAFFGLGAYAAGILGARYGWSPIAGFPLALAVPAAVALVIAIPVLRLESHYFALATLVIGQVALLVAVNWEDVTGGANGLPGVPGISLFGLAIGRGWPALAFVWALVAAGGLCAWRFGAGANGLAYRLMREVPLAAGALGIDAGRLRLVAFVLSAAYAGAAGALYVHTIGVISPEALEFPIMVSCLTMAVIGGRARVAGAILGALLLVHLPEWVRVLEHYYLIAYGAAALAVIVVAPEGLVGALERLRPARAPAPPAPVPLPPAPAPTRSPALAIEDLHLAFGGVAAVDGVSLTLQAGEIYGLIGPNGSGKTTLANLITGLYAPTRGSVRVRGREVGGWPAHRIARAGVARTFQVPALVDRLGVLDNVAAARAWTDRDLATARAHASAALARLDLGELAAAPAGSLAHGLRRRVEIARAIAAAPTLLILDEPAAGLTAVEQQGLARTLRTLAAEGAALLVIEHDVAFLAALADRIGCLDRGRLIAEGPPATVRLDGRVRAAYFGTAA